MLRESLFCCHVKKASIASYVTNLCFAFKYCVHPQIVCTFMQRDTVQMAKMHVHLTKHSLTLLMKENLYKLLVYTFLYQVYLYDIHVHALGNTQTFRVHVSFNNMPSS
jgi:hypothetical protein